VEFRTKLLTKILDNGSHTHKLVRNILCSTNGNTVYDLRQMKMANINSIRVDFAWRDIENDGEGVYAWDTFDFLVTTCEQNGIKIFPLIGYQWPPDWFQGVVSAPIVDGTTSGWFSMHPPSPAPGQDVTPETYVYTTYWTSDIMSFTHPTGIQKYQNFMAAVANRYKNSEAIAAWIVGNEYGFLGLWSFRFDGYDPTSQDAFRTYLTDLYSSDITKLNYNWGSSYTSFDQISMTENYDRDDPSWADLIQWRKYGVADFIAGGAKAVRAADPNHLLSYAMVGMIFGGVDWMYEAEDNIRISARCREVGAPLDFWSINNYPSSYPGNELRTGTYGIEFAKRTGLPVMYTETGASATDAGFVGFNDPDERQGALLRNFAWEAYINGVIGVHIFTWPDRDYITDREYGFGILKRYREQKASYKYITELFYQIALIEQHTPALFTSLKFEKYDVAFYWPSFAIDQMYCRFQNNLAGVWGPLTRLGLRSRFMNETQLYAGEYKQVQLIILPRNQRMLPQELQYFNDVVIPAGVHVYAEADLPGYQDYYSREQSDFTSLMDTIFGIQPIEINAYEDVISAYDINMSPYTTVELQPTVNMGYMYAYQSTWFGVWKYHKVATTSGTTVVNMLLQRENNTLVPGIVMKNHTNAKSIISMFSLGDTNCEALDCWTGHYAYYSGLFLTPQGLNMQTSVGVTGSAMLQTQLMDTENGMKLLYFTNWDDYSTDQLTLTIPSIVGMTVKDLLNNRKVISSYSDGIISLELGPNAVGVYLIGEPLAPSVSFMYNETNVDIKPTLAGSQIALEFDTSASSGQCVLKVQLLRQGSGTIYASAATLVKGVGWTSTNLTIQDYSVLNTDYQSSDQGNLNYYYEASLTCAGFTTATSTLNAQLSWPVYPKNLPSSVTAGTPVIATISYENLPISRLNAFQGVVAVWNSSKTAAVDPTHYNKVAQVATMLESIGYTFSRMIAWDEGLQDYGPLYHVFNDTVPDDPTGMGNLGAAYFAEYIKYIILPGVSVMSDDETTNLRTWLMAANFTDITLISTEGGVGRLDGTGANGVDRLADLFGVTSNVATTSTVQVDITDMNHPLTYSLANVSYTGVSSGGAVATAVTTGVAHGSVTDGSGKYPAIISNQLSDWSKALMLNFDLTNAGDLNGSGFWTLISNWMHTNSQINKLRWQATCDNRTIASTDAWIVQGTGSQQVTVTPSESCSGSDLTWQGFLYYWNVTDPITMDNNLGYYTSANDAYVFLNSAGRNHMGWIAMIVCLIVAIIM
jgi:hypothetical protein